MYVDDCCSIRPKLASVFHSLRSDSGDSVDSSAHSFLKLGYQYQLITTTVACQTACLELVPREENSKTYAIDCEWSLNHSQRQNEEKGVDVIQICDCDLSGTKKVYVFHIAKFGSTSFPRILKSLIENTKIKWVGCCLWSDRSKLKGNDVILHKAQCVEVGAMAKDRRLCPRANFSLANLCKILFNVALNKEQSLRCDDWKSDLSADKIKYAALDAYATAMVYQKLEGIVSPLISQPPESFEKGDKVRLFTQGLGVFVVDALVEKDPSRAELASKSIKLIISKKDITTSGAIKHPTTGKSISFMCKQQPPDVLAIDSFKLEWPIKLLRSCPPPTDIEIQTESPPRQQQQPPQQHLPQRQQPPQQQPLPQRQQPAQQPQRQHPLQQQPTFIAGDEVTVKVTFKDEITAPVVFLGISESIWKFNYTNERNEIVAISVLDSVAVAQKWDSVSPPSTLNLTIAKVMNAACTIARVGVNLKKLVLRSDNLRFNGLEVDLDDNHTVVRHKEEPVLEEMLDNILEEVWETVRIKLDILHIFIRFQKVMYYQLFIILCF